MVYTIHKYIMKNQTNYIIIMNAIGYTLLFVGINKLKISAKYSKYDKYGLLGYIKPVGALYFQYKAITELEVLTFPTKSFWSFIINSFTFFNKLSLSVSIITLLIGFPALSFLIHHILKVIDKHIIDPNKALIIDGINALKNNNNWDIEWQGVSLKTFKTAVKIHDEAELNKLFPLRSKSTNNITDSEYSNECAVCLDKLNFNQLHRELSCKHVFHPHCIDDWVLKCSASCPICRKDINLD